jgi:hypothetical protein
MSTDDAPEPSLVAGDRLERSLVDFVRACETILEEEQRLVSPNNALIGLLCDAVRLAREHSSARGAHRPEDLDAAIVAICNRIHVDVSDWKAAEREIAKFPALDLLATDLLLRMVVTTTERDAATAVALRFAPRCDLEGTEASCLRYAPWSWGPGKQRYCDNCIEIYPAPVIRSRFVEHPDATWLRAQLDPSRPRAREGGRVPTQESPPR